MTFTLTEAIKTVILDVMHVVTSADKAYHYLREQGYEWTRAFVREAWRETGQADYWRTVLETYGTERTVPKAWTVTRETVEAKGFMHTVEIQTQRWEDGRLETRYMSVVSDRLMSYDNVISELEADIDAYGEVFGFSVISVRPGGVINMVPKE